MPTNKFSEPWIEFANRWKKYYQCPGKPTPGAVKTYKKFILATIKGLRKKPKGLVLGATPELRDLLNRLNFEVTIIDISMEMILAMTELMKTKNAEEIIVKGDWLTNPLAANYYDIVIGDLVLNNVPKEKQSQFIKKIYKLLKPHGSFISKIFVSLDNWKPKKIEEAISIYSKAPYLTPYTQEPFCYLLNVVWNRKTKVIDISIIKKWMDKYKIRNGVYKHPSKKITKLLNEIWIMWKPMNKCWSMRKKMQTLSQFTPYFKLIGEQILNDCHFHQVDEMFPVWSLKKK